MNEEDRPASNLSGSFNLRRVRGRRKLAWCAAGSLLILYLLNFTLLPVFLGLKPFIHVYHYESSDGGYRGFECPEKGRKYGMVQRQFAAYQEECDKSDAVLYRTQQRHFWKVWNWADYLTHPRWDIPFRRATIHNQPGTLDWTPGSECPQTE